MRIGILSSYPGWHGADLARAARALGLDLVPLDYRSLAAAVGPRGEEFSADGTCLLDLDRLLVRSMPPASLEQVVYRMDVLGRLAAAGLRIINSPRAIECAVDKYLALSRLEARGLPVPRTRVAERKEQALVDFAALGGDVVLKPLFGSEGRGMVRLSDPELARRAFAALERIGAVIYQQQYIPHPGWDLRVLVIGGRVAAAMRRRSPEGFPAAAGSWRTNISQGGRGEKVDLDGGAAGLAVRAAAAVGTEIAGVDLLPDPQGGLHVLEVNSAPSWRGLAPVAGVDVASAILGYLREPAPPGGGTPEVP